MRHPSTSVNTKPTRKLFIMAGEEHFTVLAYEYILKAIVSKKKFTPDDLMDAAAFNMKYSEYHVVTLITWL